MRNMPRKLKYEFMRDSVWTCVSQKMHLEITQVKAKLSSLPSIILHFKSNLAKFQFSNS